MAILLKTKTQPKPLRTKIVVDPHEEKVTEIVKMVDELAGLTAEYEAAKKTVKEYEAAKKKLGDIASSILPGPDATRTFSGALGIVEVGACGSARKIEDMAAVRKALGDATFMKVASVGLGELDKLLSGAEKSALLVQVRTESRPVKIIVKPIVKP